MIFVMGDPVWVARHRVLGIFRFGAFAGTAIFGGAIIGLTCGALLEGQNRLTFAILSMAAATFLAREIWFRSLPLLQVKAQVPVQLKDRVLLAPALYGTLLGAGLFTYVPSALFYLYLVSLILAATAVQGAVVGAAFGIAYSLAVLVMASISASDSELEQAQRALFLLGRARTVLVASAAVAVAVVVAFGIL